MSDPTGGRDDRDRAQGGQAPWDSPYPKEEPDGDGGPPTAAWPAPPPSAESSGPHTPPPWARQDQPEQRPYPPERPSRVSRPYLNRPGADQHPSGPLPQPQPDPGQQQPEQHPSGPFDASGAPVRPPVQPYAQPGEPPPAPDVTPMPPLPPAAQAHPGAQGAPGAPGAQGAPGAGRQGPQGAPGPADPAGDPGTGRTGRQARLKAGADRQGNGRRSGPFALRPGKPARPPRQGQPPRQAHQPRPERPARPERPGGTGGRRANLLLAAALLVVAACGAALVSRLPSGGQTAAGAAAAPIAPPYSSRWLCPVVPTSDGVVTVANAGKDATQLRATLSSAPAEPADAAATATRRELRTGEPLPAGQARSLPVQTKQPSLLEVESFGAPIAVGAAGQPTCATSAAERWWLTPADTSVGKVDVLLANPGDEGAVVQLVLHASNTVYRPGALKRVFVPAHSAVRRNLNGFAELDMSVEVVALLGRVVAGAVTTAPGADEPVVIPGQPGARASWSFAGGRGGKGDDTSLALANPSLDPLVVDVRVVTTKDAFTPPGFEDLEIPSGATRRVPIDVNNAPGGVMGVEVRSRTGAPFTASLVVRPKAGSGDPYIDGGSARLWGRWLLPGAGGKRSVVLANLGNSPVAATIADLGRPGEPAIPVKVAAGRVAVKEIDGAKGGVVVQGDHSGLVVTPGAGGGAVPSVMVEGTPLRGPVVQGPAAG